MSEKDPDADIRRLYLELDGYLSDNDATYRFDVEAGLDRLKAAFEFDVEAGLDRLKAAFDTNDRDVGHSGSDPTTGTQMSLDEVVELLGVDGDLPIAAELDPYHLGATPTAFGSAGRYGLEDPYVARTANDLEARLHAALSKDAVVVVTGGSKVGKSRTLFEAVRSELPQARVLVPSRTALHVLSQHPGFINSGDTIVVWLDDLDNYLFGENALTPRLLTDLLAARRARTVVVGTMRSEVRDRLHHDSGEFTRDPREVLSRATLIEMASTSDDPGETMRAVAAYPRLLLRPGPDFGLAEVLAGAPALLQTYDDLNYVDPALRAVIEVAVDWSRIGRPDAIRGSVLTALAAQRIRSTRPGVEIRTRQLEAAIAVARTPIQGAIAALRTILFSDNERGYRAFDYLVAADDGHAGRPPRPIPDSFWDAATYGAGPEILAVVGATAFLRGATEHGANISRRAAAAGHPVAMYNLGLQALNSEDFIQAEGWWRKAVQAGDADAMCNLGRLLEDRDESAEAERWYRAAADAGNAYAMHNLAGFLDERGESAEAERWYRAAADAGASLSMFSLAVFLDERGEPAEAERWYRAAADAGNAYAIDHLGRLVEDQGESASTNVERAADAEESAAAETPPIMSDEASSSNESNDSSWRTSANSIQRRSGGRRPSYPALGSCLRTRAKVSRRRTQVVDLDVDIPVRGLR